MLIFLDLVRYLREKKASKSRQGSVKNMTHRLLGSVSALAAALLASLHIQPAAALTITFDDLTDTSGGFGGTPIANGYQGSNWINWNVLDSFDSESIFGPNGAVAGTVSVPNVAYNPTGGEAIFSSATPFDFDSAYLTAVWNQGMSVTVTGLLNGTQEDQAVLTNLSPIAATLETFDWSGINEVDLLATGGTPYSAYSGSGTQVAMDNLTITPVPEPVSALLLGSGLLGLAFACRRRKSA
jgi:hypothetical protein